MTSIASRWRAILRLPMAVHTPTHRQRSILFHAFHFLNFAMANLAGESARDVPTVVEINEFGQVVDFDPRKWNSPFIVIGEFLYVGTVFLNDRVTVQTDIHRRNGRMARSLRGDVAIHTWNVVLARVFFVTERNRLNRSIALIFRGHQRVRDTAADGEKDKQRYQDF